MYSVRVAVNIRFSELLLISVAINIMYSIRVAVNIKCHAMMQSTIIVYRHRKVPVPSSGHSILP